MKELDNALDQTERKRDVSGHAGYFTLLLVLCAALAIHELTGNALLAAAIVAAHAGWRSLRCGWWLLRADPSRPRGWVCFWFYTATAFWKAAIWALVGLLILGASEAVTGQPPTEEQIAAQGITMFLAMGLSSLVGIIGVASAIRNKVRVWVHPSVWGRCGGEFARLGGLRGYFLGDRGTFYRGFNHAIFVVAASLLVSTTGIPVAFCIWSEMANAPAGGGPTIAEGLALIVAFVGPFAMIPVYAVLSHRVIARTPAECWPLSTIYPLERRIP